MKKSILKSTSAIALLGAIWGAITGCMDLNLLDNMTPWDTDTATISMDAGTDSHSDPATDSQEKPQPDLTDVTPPGFVTQCTSGEQSLNGACGIEGPASLYLRFTTDEPAAIRASLESVTVLSAEWTVDHEVLLLKAGAMSSLAFDIADANNNSRSIAIELNAITEPAVIITQVLADCIGPEPDGEYVKIANIGKQDADISGWMLDDNGDRNGDVFTPGTVLPAGAEATVALNGFNAQFNAHNELLIPLESSIGSGGLKNSESESVQLWREDGTLIDEYVNGMQIPQEGVPYARRHLMLPPGAPELWQCPTE